jgi:hypothetical protein
VKRVRVQELSALSDREWDDVVGATGVPFRFSHRADAGRAFEAAYDGYAFEPVQVRYDDGTAMLVPLVRIQRRLKPLTTMMGMPLGLEGTPLTIEGRVGPQHLRGLFGALDACGRLVVHGGAGASPPVAGDTSRATTHILDLRPGYDVLWTDAFSSANRNSCRKAEKASVEVAAERGREAAGIYYDIYASASAKWGYAEPPYPRELVEALLDSSDAELWLAREDGDPIAGAILLHGSEDVLYWSGATLPGRQQLAPNNALLAGAIQVLCERGVRYLDFGASKDLPGVQKFKESFGAMAVDYAIADVTSLGYRALERLRG